MAAKEILLLFTYSIFPILGQLLGGWNQAEVNDESIQDVAQFALTTINQRSNSLYLSKMVEVIHAESQVKLDLESNRTLVQGSLFLAQLFIQ